MSASSLPPSLSRTHRAPRSTFVNVLAWLSLALGLLGVVSGVLQAMMLASLDLGAQVTAGLQEGGAQDMLPPQMLWVFQHLQLINAVSTLASLITAVVSWALWRRYEWGRLGFIALLLLGAATGIAGAVWAAGVMDALLAQAAGDPVVARMLAATKATLYSGSLIIAVLHAGIAWKLHTPEIRAEFDAA